MTNLQILDAINQNIKRNENKEITGVILNSVLRMLLDFVKDYIDAKTGDQEANHTHTKYAKNDATSLTAENVTAWQNKLGVADLKFDDKAITITQDYADFGLVAGASINAFNNAIYSEVAKKLDAPTENATNEYVLMADGSVVAKSEFGKVDKVMGVAPGANKNVDISGVAMNWTNSSHRYSGLLDKSADATFNQLLGVDSNGYAAKVNGKTVFINLPDILTESEKTAWKTKMNGGWTTQTMSVFSISPLVVPKLDEHNFMVISGANLNLNPVNFKIEIISALTQNVIAEIPSNQVNLISNSSLNFYYNFKDLSESEYKIKITNGLASYITPLTFYVKKNINYINLSNNTWETWKHDIDSVVVTETPQILQTINTLQTGKYYGQVVNTKLSKVLFEANDNFVLTYTVVQSANTNANPILKIGLTDLSDVNNLDNNIIGIITKFSGPQIQNSINGGVVNSINNSPTTVTIIKDKNKLTQIISTPTATSIESTIVNILSPVRLKVLFHGVSESDATSKFQIKSCYKF